MSLRCNRTGTGLQVAGVAMAAMILGAVLTHRAEAAVWRVCIDQANPTSATDERVARAIADSQGNSLSVVPFEGYGKGGDGFPLSRFAKMAQSDCALIMGFPVDFTSPNLPPQVSATSPYASTGFVLVRRGRPAHMSLADLPKGSEVGIAQLDTYAGTLYAEFPDIVMHVYPTDAEMLADLAANRIAAAMAWQPTIESYATRHARRANLSVRQLPGRHMLWNLVALYAPESGTTAKQFDQGLRTLAAGGQLGRLIRPYQDAARGVAEDRIVPATENIGRLRDAIAWSSDSGSLLPVSDTPAGAKSKHAKVPALFTEDQANKGAIAYYQNCAMCHGPVLNGQAGGYSGPALKGADFADPSYDFHVSDIFNFVAKQMPAATPGSLPKDQYVQIMAFILQQNGYPAGDKELTYEEADGSKVPMRYYGK